MMSAYVDGELTGAEMLEIRRHFSECEDCNQEYESIKLTKHVLARLATMRPRPEFAAELLSQLDIVRVPRYQRFLNFFGSYAHRKLSPVAAALGACGVALVILSAGSMDTGPQSADMVASAPLGVRIEQASFLGDLRGDSSVIYGQEPLRVADEMQSLDQPSLRFASLTAH